MFGETIFTAIVGVLAFAATNLDDLVVLTAYLAAGRVTRSEAIRGQVAGMAAVMALSMVGAMGTVLIPPRLLPWLGLLPVGIGLSHLWRAWIFWRSGAPKETKPPSRRNASAGTLTIALLVLANSGDNLGVYIPLFSAQSFLMSGVQIALALGMAALWAAFAAALVNHPKLGAPLRQIAAWLLPWVLIGIGVLILLP
jgi:cadmium resistance protein CadD (predicted permease)